MMIDVTKVSEVGSVDVNFISVYPYFAFSGKIQAITLQASHWFYQECDFCYFTYFQVIPDEQRALSREASHSENIFKNKREDQVIFSELLAKEEK